ncbi:hypothetical protein Tco_0657328 [Tanacetum coccineum]|uniref:Uncharacterized protein n=1 Tax=Tanacetum coccineum TaxID=301880 RepID=A0ABQ4XBA5_9ASTR
MSHAVQKQVQPALYNGHVLVMSNHARPVVHDSEDTREISEITRKRMLEKIVNPLCVNRYFGSIDNNDRKKAETSVPKPLSALTVYPPNTPVKLVPRILPTKSQNEHLEQNRKGLGSHLQEMFESIRSRAIALMNRTSSLLNTDEDLKLN